MSGIDLSRCELLMDPDPDPDHPTAPENTDNELINMQHGRQGTDTILELSEMDPRYEQEAEDGFRETCSTDRLVDYSMTDEEEMMESESFRGENQPFREHTQPLHSENNPYIAETQPVTAESQPSTPQNQPFINGIYLICVLSN